MQRIPPSWREVQQIRSRSAVRLIMEATGTGLFAAIVIGLFRAAFTFLGALFTPILAQEGHDLFGLSFVLLLVFLTGLGLLGAFLVRVEPSISGSGIPQVELVLEGKLAPMRWLRVLLAKFLGTLISLSAGLSLGREGPCIMMGACCGQGVGTLFGTRDVEPRFLVGGSVAGMTAAFGAPLAGLAFAFEEMRTLLTPPLVLFCVLAAGTSFFVLETIFQFGLVFPLVQTVGLSSMQLFAIPLIGLICGAFGALYNEVLYQGLLLADRVKIPVLVRRLLPFWGTALLCFLFPHIVTNVGFSLPYLESAKLGSLFLLLLLFAKMFFSSFSFAGGLSGGLLMPMLVTGAFLGAFVGTVFVELDVASYEQMGYFMTLAMGGLFAATVRTPITASFLVCEMTGLFSALLPMLTISLISVFIANHLHVPPIYTSLKERISHLQKKRHNEKSL